MKLLIGLMSLMLASSAWAQGGAFFKYKGKSYSANELSPKMKQSLFEIEQEHYQKMSNLMDAIIVDEHLEAQMKKTGKTREQVEEELLAVGNPSDAEVKKWFEDNKNRIPPGYKLEQIKGDIETLLKNEKRKGARDKLLAKLKKDGKAQALFSEPEPPVLKIAYDGFPIKGNKKAKVTIVEFADYQCPHCKDAVEEIKKVMNEYKDKVRLVFLDFPINRSGISTVVAHGAVCADEQGKFWEYHEAAFAKQRTLTKESPTSLAKELKLDEGKFKKCLDSEGPKTKVAKAKAEGDRIGVRGTPSLYVNGRRVVNYSYDELKEAIDVALKSTSS